MTPTRKRFEWRYNNGGREFRGLHNERYTYIRTLKGPWLLYDNQTDPMQLRNLVDDPAYAAHVARFPDFHGAS